jgi:hypothetical protein
MSTLPLKGIRVTIDPVNKEFFLATKHGACNGYKPVSLYRDKLDLIKHVAKLLDLEVEIKNKS